MPHSKKGSWRDVAEGGKCKSAAAFAEWHMVRDAMYPPPIHFNVYRQSFSVDPECRGRLRTRVLGPKKWSLLVK